jgi:nitrate/nitrite-specific signal transduction histidine kinase
MIVLYAMMSFLVDQVHASLKQTNQSLKYLYKRIEYLNNLLPREEKLEEIREIPLIYYPLVI